MTRLLFVELVSSLPSPCRSHVIGGRHHMFVTRLCILAPCCVEVGIVRFPLACMVHLQGQGKVRTHAACRCQDGRSWSSATPVREGLPLGVRAIPNSNPKIELPNPNATQRRFAAGCSAWTELMMTDVLCFVCSKFVSVNATHQRRRDVGKLSHACNALRRYLADATQSLIALSVSTQHMCTLCTQWCLTSKNICCSGMAHVRTNPYCRPCAPWLKPGCRE